MIRVFIGLVIAIVLMLRASQAQASYQFQFQLDGHTIKVHERDIYLDGAKQKVTSISYDDRVYRYDMLGLRFSIAKYDHGAAFLDIYRMKGEPDFSLTIVCYTKEASKRAKHPGIKVSGKAHDYFVSASEKKPNRKRAKQVANSLEEV